MDIEKLMLPIAEFTEYGEVCFAHLSENGERKETLREHTELCQKYWKEIVKRKKIDEIFQEFENVYLEELSKESRNLFELMTVNIVSVHDLGKINPNFQSDKMHHKWHEEVKPDPNIGSRHSILSSVFYLDYFLGKINEMWEAKQLIKKSEAEILKDFAYIYSYIISRHHGELKEFETYMASLTVAKNPYDKALFVKNENKISYEDKKYTSRLGVDVSVFQGDIDWEQVKAAGYEFAILRIGYRGYGEEGTLNADEKFEQNLENARKAGIDVGVYFFSQAVNEEEAKEEADFVLEHLKGKELQMPVVYDPEHILEDEARTDGVTGEQFTQNAKVFCKEIEEAGYDAMIYSNMLWEAYELDLEKLLDYPVWYADYEELPQTPYRFSMWQYSSTGSVTGIEGNVDLNIQLLKK